MEKWLGTANSPDNLGRLSNLGSLGKKWIEMWTFAKYPHYTGFCKDYVYPCQISFPMPFLSCLYGGRIDDRFAKTPGS